MKDKKKKEMLAKRVVSNTIALAVVVSSLFAPQGAITAYADEPTTPVGITVEVDNSSSTSQSTYSATQIVNGNFETSLWESFVYDGKIYTSKPSSLGNVNVSSVLPNGVGMGWNTTEIKTYQSSLFEVWSVQGDLHGETETDFSKNGNYFIEMNANNSAALYQDLPTRGGDVIKWTLQHADRAGFGLTEQRMYVTIGAPEQTNGEISAATGVNDKIDTKIQDYGKAEYRYNGITDGEGETAFANLNELEGLSVTKGASEWRDVAGIYVVPEGQDVTRFAFCADSEVDQTSGAISGGNFLDNITFSTLIGNLKAAKKTDNSVEITGYWGDEDTTKKLIVELDGTETQEVDMSSVCKKNFIITIPEDIVGDSTSIKIYHQNYESAKSTVEVTHEHVWNYRKGDDDKLYAYCSGTEEPVCSWQEANKMPLTLTATDMVYSGKPYAGAAIDKEEKKAWEAAGLDAPIIMYSGTEETNYDSSPTAPTNAGTYKAEIEVNGIKAEASFAILPKSISAAGNGMTVKIEPDSYAYDGTEKTPAITVKDGDIKLEENTHYTLSGDTTGSALSGDSDYKITVTGIGNYKDAVEKAWRITRAPRYAITLESDGNGTASAAVAGDKVTSAGCGDEVTLTAIPNTGYRFKQWIVSEGGITITNSKFVMPDTAVTVKAEFEIISGGSGGTGGSGGSGTPSAPGEPAKPTENLTIPVKNENTVKIEAEIESGTAKVSEITVDTIGKVVNNADKESKVDTITIDLSGAKQEVTGVTLSKKSVETLAKTTAEKDNGIETATIELSKATVVLDNKTLETLVEQAKGSQIKLVVEDTEQKNLNTAQQTTLSEWQVATTFEAYFTSDGQRIHDFKGGKAVVSIDFVPEAGRNTKNYHLVYVADDGNLTRYKTKCENGKLMFTTTHFSDYAVIYDINDENETEELPKEDEKKDDSTDTDTQVTLDTTYRKLRLRVPTSTRTTNVLKWTKVSDADGYVIYGNKCNTKDKTYELVQRKVIKNGATTTWTDKNLASSTYYKYYIKAYKLVNGKKVWLAKSKVVHSTTTGGKYGNAKSVKLNKTSVSLAVGKNFTIKAEQIKKDLPIKMHTVIKFESGNGKVASVNSMGVIKAKSKGTCYIYVYAQNGMYKRIKVTVK